ncbi:MAG TPA: S9 family peptidase, partial [Vicinamibacteria bacterium]|nr:S9 family peptidase [Vicinamibacteria bacterium]
MKHVLLSCFALILATSWAHAAQPRALTIDDYFRFRNVSDPQISPDSLWIAYSVETANLEEDDTETRIWMVPAAGGEPIPMTSEGSSASRPRWSPDGRYLAFLSDRNDQETQVWTLFRQGGDPVQRTEVVQGVSSFDWSPDGRRMVLVIKDASPEELEESDDDEEEKTPKPWVIDRLQFKEDYVGYLDHRRTHLYVLDVETGEQAQITSGDYDDTEPAWSPDGKHIAFVSNRTDEPDRNYNTDIWVVAGDDKNQGKT